MYIKVIFYICEIISVHSEDQIIFINTLCEFHADLLTGCQSKFQLLSCPVGSMWKRGCGKSCYIEIITDFIWCRGFYISYINRVLFSIYEALLLYVITAWYFNPHATRNYEVILCIRVVKWECMYSSVNWGVLVYELYWFKRNIAWNIVFYSDYNCLNPNKGSRALQRSTMLHLF
jgi:hypothetical protein